jgi:hypothetical protein
MKLGVLRNTWTKFHKNLKLLSNLFKYPKFKTFLATLNFHSEFEKV